MLTSQKHLILACMDTNYSLLLLLTTSPSNTTANTDIFNFQFIDFVGRDIPAFGDPSILSRQRRSTAVKNKCKGSEIDTKVSMKRKLVVYFTI